MKLVHFSAAPLEKIESKVQYNENDIPYHSKPKGLWVSDEDDYGWKQWCESEEFQLERLKYKHEIILSEKANILYVRNEKELDELTMEYKNGLPGMPPSDFVHLLKWDEIAKLYDGLIITPYLWGRRLENSSMWYYGWDCASGCIWNKEAIESFKLIVEEEKENA